jgi:hypothetical protein
MKPSLRKHLEWRLQVREGHYNTHSSRTITSLLLSSPPPPRGVCSLRLYKRKCWYRVNADVTFLFCFPCLNESPRPDISQDELCPYTLHFWMHPVKLKHSYSSGMSLTDYLPAGLLQCIISLRHTDTYSTAWQILFPFTFATLLSLTAHLVREDSKVYILTCFLNDWTNTLKCPYKSFVDCRLHKVFVQQI